MSKNKNRSGVHLELKKNKEKDVTLEMVVKDMTNVLHNLTNEIKTANSQYLASSVNIKHDLEVIFKEQINKKPLKLKSEQTAHKRQFENSKKQRSEISESTTEKAPNKSRPGCKQRSSTHRASSLVNPPKEVYNPLGIIKNEVDLAIRKGKTFTIKGRCPAVRRALISRGWVEKFAPSTRASEDVRKFLQFNIADLVDLLRRRDVADVVARVIKSKLLQNNQVDLYWDHTGFTSFKECSDSIKLTLINKLRRLTNSFTSKPGLCKTAMEAYWLEIPGVAKINHPRSYLLMKGEDTKSFLKHFNLTAAISLLKWVEKNHACEESKIVSNSGKIPMRTFDFAIAECFKYIKTIQHQDIDAEIPEALEVEWNEFLEQFYKTVHVGNHFRLRNKTLNAQNETKDMVRKAKYLLNELREYMPSMDMDGYMNIWILKPTNGTRGQGIHICRTLQYILDVVKKNPTRRFLVQKYIERPFLIHETKFDIRQWFLISSAYPLTIWLYQISYLRFSSQTYNLRKLHESIHLTNNSIQAKYMKSYNRDPLLPAHGMWDSRQFKNYLSDIGYPDIFDKVIYSGMRECITGAVIAHRDSLDRRKNCFEIYGADFMLSPTFEPWILEINANPALDPSTPVTAKLCPQMLEDVIKVMVDYRNNPKAPTGGFEKVYQEPPDATAPTKRLKLALTGAHLPNDYFCNLTPDESNKQLVRTKLKLPAPTRQLVQTGHTLKEALRNLSTIMKKEKQKQRSNKDKSMVAKMETFDSVIQTRTEIISLFQNLTISKMSSNQSITTIMHFDSDDELSQEEAKRVSDVIDSLKLGQNRKQVLCDLLKVVGAIQNPVHLVE